MMMLCEDFRDIVRAPLHLAYARMLLHFPGHAYAYASTRMQLLMCPRD